MNLAVRAALVGLLLFSVFSGLERFAVTAVVWEFAEYWTFTRDSPELETAYEDTLGDLALGLSGSTIAAFVTGWLVRRRARAPASPRPARRPA